MSETSLCDLINNLMKNKVFYGEYTLKHWIELIFKRNILLPEYQRHFVWNEGQMRKLLKSMRTSQFVPTIVIGAFKGDDGIKNYILDGQQRLTTVLFAYLGYMLNREHIKTVSSDEFINENDDTEDNEPVVNIAEWTFRELIDTDVQKNTKENIASTMAGKNTYMPFSIDLPDDFFETTLLGFSYVVPMNNDMVAQTKFYSTVFRDINILGTELMIQEARESLYYLNMQFKELFAPDFAKVIGVTNKFTSNPPHMDFVRYLSLLSQYMQDVNGKEKHLAMGFSGRKMEAYYENFIYDVAVNHTEDGLFKKFSDIFLNNSYQQRLQSLKTVIERHHLMRNDWPSIIDMDYYFFGLIYEVFFQSKTLEDAVWDTLNSEIDKKIRIAHKDERHQKNPAALKYLRQRVAESIRIYKKYTR